MAEEADAKIGDDGDTSGDEHDAAARTGYAVGYGKPPRHTRFKPGQSGNPSGRPRKPRSLARDLVEVLHEPVTLGDGDARETISTQHSILRALAAKAMEGDAKAMAQVIQLAQWMSGFRPAYYFTAPEDWAEGGETPENSLPTRE